jgi:putative protein kinase ArgK-like GTPase of G3E family
MTDSSPVNIIALAKNLRASHRAALARAITLIESRCDDHRAAARDLVQPQGHPPSALKIISEFPKFYLTPR